MTLVGTLLHTEQNRQGSGLLRTTGSSTAGGHTIDKKKKNSDSGQAYKDNKTE